MIGTSATFFIGVSLLIATIGLPLTKHVLLWMSMPAGALQFAVAYLRIIFIAVPFLYCFAFLSAILRGAGDTPRRSPMPVR